MGIETTIDTPLAHAVRTVGSQSAYARLTKRSQSAIYERLRTGKAVDAEDVLAVEEATGLSRSYLRADLYPDESGHDVDPGQDRTRAGTAQADAA